MTKTNKPKIYLDTADQRLSDFLYVYYDPFTASQMKKIPEFAVSTLMEDIASGIRPLGRLQAYARALRDATEVMGTSLTPKTKPAKKSLKTPLNGSA